VAILVRNVSMTQDAERITVPTRPDGTYYRFELICDGGWSRVYDDTTSGLLGHMIPGYLALTHEQQLAARIQHAVDNQVRLQAQLNSFFNNTPRTTVEDDILNGCRDAQPLVAQWDCAVPLVAIDTFYAPYTDNQIPVSGIADVAMPPNLWWLKPGHGELEYLRSLHEASLVDLHISKEEVV